MNVKLLVDAIMRQTTVLIAQISTAAGVRAPLAHLADQVFLSLAKEIEAQGVGKKVVAFLDQLGENLAPLGILSALAVFDIGPFTMSCHGLSFSFEFFRSCLKKASHISMVCLAATRIQKSATTKKAGLQAGLTVLFDSC
jgi:hypothetical protein